MTAIFKIVKSTYIRNHLTDFDEIWHSDACWWTASILKIQKHIFSGIAEQRITQIWQ